jgi:hypothetical protein
MSYEEVTELEIRKKEGNYLVNTRLNLNSRFVAFILGSHILLMHSSSHRICQNSKRTRKLLVYRLFSFACNFIVFSAILVIIIIILSRDSSHERFLSFRCFTSILGVIGRLSTFFLLWWCSYEIRFLHHIVYCMTPWISYSPCDVSSSLSFSCYRFCFSFRMTSCRLCQYCSRKNSGCFSWVCLCLDPLSTLSFPRPS